MSDSVPAADLLTALRQAIETDHGAAACQVADDLLQKYTPASETMPPPLLCGYEPGPTDPA